MILSFYRENQLAGNMFSDKIESFLRKHGEMRYDRYSDTGVTVSLTR